MVIEFILLLLSTGCKDEINFLMSSLKFDRGRNNAYKVGSSSQAVCYRPQTDSPHTLYIHAVLPV